MIGNGKRVCLFTGASGALGSAFCRRYAREYDIVAVYRNRLPAAPSQEAAFVDPLDPDSRASLNRHPVFAVQADLQHETELERVVDVALARFGRIDMLVNAAVFSIWAPMGSSELEDSMLQQYQMNAVVPVKLAALVAARFWRQLSPEENRAARRNVVNISSTAGVYAYFNSGQSVYAATKAALNMLTCHMADELRSIGVRANATAPNSFEIVPASRVAAAIAAFDRGNQTGQILVMDHDGDDLI